GCNGQLTTDNGQFGLLIRFPRHVRHVRHADWTTSPFYANLTPNWARPERKKWRKQRVSGARKTGAKNLTHGDIALRRPKTHRPQWTTDDGQRTKIKPS